MIGQQVKAISYLSTFGCRPAPGQRLLGFWSSQDTHEETFSGPGFNSMLVTGGLDSSPSQRAQ